MIVALACTGLAGAATTLGALVASGRAAQSSRGLAAGLTFASGAMMLVSLAEIPPTGARSLSEELGTGAGWGITMSLAVVGAGAVTLATLPVRRARVVAVDQESSRSPLARTGLVVALAVAAHNGPEGMATLVATADDPATGAGVATAIAVHNLPEGVAVAAPLLTAGASRRRAVGVATLAGIAEPIGGVLGYLILVAFLPTAAFGAIFGLVAGVMVQINVSELLPAAGRLAPRPFVRNSCLIGAAVMAGSLVLLRFT